MKVMIKATETTIDQLSTRVATGCSSTTSPHWR